MAARDLSKTFDEFESDELSLETSVPTDLTLSPERETDRFAGDRKDRRTKITRQLIERKQLMHDMQLLRIELSQKNLTLENVKAESLQRVEELEERLNDALHQKQILTARLESQLTIQEQESKRRQNLVKEELEDVRRKQQQLEGTNEKLQEREGGIGQSEEDLSLRDYVAMKFYEAVRPVQTECDELRLRTSTLEADARSSSKQISELQSKLDQERDEHGDIRVKYQKLVMDLSETKSQVKQEDYKVNNYDQLKHERDNLEHDRLESQRQLTVLDGSHHTLQKERDELHSDFTAAKQSLSLLKQDKDYLTKQVSDLTNRCTYAEEKLQQINAQLDDAKRSREEMYENMSSSRNLREARDMSMSEKDRAQNTERETSTKYEQLMTQFRELQMNGDNKVVELQNDLKLKGFEVERTLMVHEETVRNLKEAQLEIEKHQKKIEVLTKEYYVLQTSMEKKVVELESHISDKKAKLETYEKVEKELDDIVMQAAEVEDETEAEKVLFSYGYGANIPSTSKRRLQQSVHLARRVLQLEKINSNQKKEIDVEKLKLKQLAEELKNSNSILDQAQQPYNYLIESIRQRDNQIMKQKDYTATLENDVKKFTKEKEDLNGQRTRCL
ncbi:CEP90 [Mytilus edulis]|uniref:PIBF1 n=1 Tax=Mytilus edulis TaxID=6550 RepID=A0A8S3RFM7_MYTED|nr:CEP90 [Mytilus edulis]